MSFTSKDVCVGKGKFSRSEQDMVILMSELWVQLAPYNRRMTNEANYYACLAIYFWAINKHKCKDKMLL